MMVSSIFPLDSKVREGTQTGRPKSVLKHVLRRVKEVPNSSEGAKPIAERMGTIRIEKMDSPIKALTRILLECRSRDDLLYLWPTLARVLESKKQSIRKVNAEEVELLDFFFSESYISESSSKKVLEESDTQVVGATVSSGSIHKLI